MGTGKTTLGRALAADLDISFCDLDQYIEQRYMKSVSALFKEFGEAGFRQIESRLLREAGDFENVVISCGGATPLFNDNMDYMNACGTTVWIDSSFEALFRRLKVARTSRPLISDKTDDELECYIKEELSRRTHFYEKAAYRYSGDKLESISQVAGSVAGVRALLGI